MKRWLVAIEVVAALMFGVFAYKASIVGRDVVTDLQNRSVADEPQPTTHIASPLESAKPLPPHPKPIRKKLTK